MPNLPAIHFWDTDGSSNQPAGPFVPLNMNNRPGLLFCLYQSHTFLLALSHFPETNEARQRMQVKHKGAVNAELVLAISKQMQS